MTAIATTAMMWPASLYANNPSEENGPEVSDIKDSGCTDKTRANSPSGLVLTKEGDIVTCEINGFVANCGVDYFDIESDYKKGNDAPDSLVIKVKPVVPAEKDCTCPYNVSFTIRDIDTASFYLDCWWYEGVIELTEGEPLVLPSTIEHATIDGLKYALRKTTHQAMLMNNGNLMEGELRIPSELSYEGQNYSVTSIAYNSFVNNKKLTKIVIPRTVKNIDFNKEDVFSDNVIYLFSLCPALESVEVEEGSSVLSSVGGVLFNKDKTKLICYPAAASGTTYTVPAGVKEIGNAAFAKNQHLRLVTMYDDVTTLGTMVFHDNKELEKVLLSSNLKDLKYALFQNCQRLKSVTIPDGVTSIEMYAFYGCNSLTSVALPNNVEWIGYGAFQDCKSLKSVKISPKLGELSESMFQGCSSLTEVTIPNGVTMIRKYSFAGCTAPKSLDIPESVSVIMGGAFYGCNLSTLYIRGFIDSSYMNSYIFQGMDTKTKVYVQPSEVEKFQAIYEGKVYPISDAGQTQGISDANMFGRQADSYDLQGRRLSKEPAHGVYIQNGRKRIK
jgi:hypothetical protein